ncbi:MAG: hypothetical protein ABJF01_17535 [bacterium]
MSAIAPAAQRVLAVPRNGDFPAPGAEFFGSVFGAVANDGLPHQLTGLAGMPPLSISPGYRLRIARVRVEWQTLDLSIPPPLSLQVLINGSATVGAAVLSRLTLQATAAGSPAAELPVFVQVAPGASVAVFATNTGAVNPQYLAAYLFGWSYSTKAGDDDYGD